jgi:hypothetical protein
MTIRWQHLALAGALACVAAAAQARPHTRPAPADAVYPVPEDLAPLCTTNPQLLQQALVARWKLQPQSVDQWTSLLRTLTCDLAGNQDLGWRRVPLRSYENAIGYPLTWVELGMRGGKPARTVTTYRSRAQLTRKLEFWIGGRIDEVRYDARRRLLGARFPAARDPASPHGLCAATRLQFRQQQGTWLLAGVEPVPPTRCS